MFVDAFDGLVDLSIFVYFPMAASNDAATGMQSVDARLLRTPCRHLSSMGIPLCQEGWLVLKKLALGALDARHVGIQRGEGVSKAAEMVVELPL